MSDKIKIKIEDIEADVYELPEGYIFTKKVTKDTLFDSINKSIAEAEIERGEMPTDKEVLAEAKAGILHPYYEVQMRLDYLNDQLKKL